MPVETRMKKPGRTRAQLSSITMATRKLQRHYGIELLHIPLWQLSQVNSINFHKQVNSMVSSQTIYMAADSLLRHTPKSWSTSHPKFINCGYIHTCIYVWHTWIPATNIPFCSGLYNVHISTATIWYQHTWFRPLSLKLLSAVCMLCEASTASVPNQLQLHCCTWNLIPSHFRITFTLVSPITGQHGFHSLSPKPTAASLLHLGPRPNFRMAFKWLP